MARSKSSRSPVRIKDSDFLKTMRARFKLADESESEQSQRERKAIAFEAGDQWPTDIQAARAGQQPINGMPAVPARPTLVINKVKEPVRQILNQERSSDIGIELVPADDFGDLGITPDDTEVTLREGLIRRIQRESIAADARTWAFKRAVIAGRGYYMVMTRYLPGKSWDQEIYVHRIYNQAGVMLDPSHEQPDGSDADWEFVCTWMPWDRFKATYSVTADGKDAKFADMTDDDFVAMAEEYPDWFQGNGEDKGEKAVRIVDYFYTKRTSETLVQLSNGQGAYEGDDLPDGVTVMLDESGKPLTREVIEKQIKFCKIAGGLWELEKTDWPGPDMPIVKVIGDEILPYDSQRRYEGVVEPAMGACMGENYMISKLVEVIGLTPIPLLQLDPEAIEGYESWYNQINTRTLPWAPYRSRNDEGQELRPPTRLSVDPNTQHLAQGVAMFDAFIKSTTAVPDSTLGNVDPALKSGKAIREVVANAAQSTSNFLDNLVRSMRYEGQIINNLLYPIYGARPGRLVRTLTGEGDSESMRIDDPQQRGVNESADSQKAQAAKVAKLTEDAHFNVIVKVSKNYDSRRQQEAANIADLVAANPEFMTWYGDILFKNSDGPGHMALAERAKVMLAPPIQQMLAAKEQGGTFDPVAQAENAQLKEQLQHADAALKELDQIANGKRMEAQTKIQIEQINGQRDVELEQLRQQAAIELQRMKDATAIRVAEINAEVKGLVTTHTAAHEADALHTELAHDAAQAELDRKHQESVTAAGMAHDAAMTDDDQSFQAEQSERLAAQQAEAGEGA